MGYGGTVCMEAFVGLGQKIPSKSFGRIHGCRVAEFTGPRACKNAPHARRSYDARDVSISSRWALDQLQTLS